MTQSTSRPRHKHLFQGSFLSLCLHWALSVAQQTSAEPGHSSVKSEGSEEDLEISLWDPQLMGRQT